MFALLLLNTVTLQDHNSVTSPESRYLPQKAPFVTDAEASLTYINIFVNKITARPDAY